MVYREELTINLDLSFRCYNVTELILANTYWVESDGWIYFDQRYLSIKVNAILNGQPRECMLDFDLKDVKLKVDRDILLFKYSGMIGLDPLAGVIELCNQHVTSFDKVNKNNTSMGCYEILELTKEIKEEDMKNYVIGKVKIDMLKGYDLSSGPTYLYIDKKSVLIGNSDKEIDKVITHSEFVEWLTKAMVGKSKCELADIPKAILKEGKLISKIVMKRRGYSIDDLLGGS